MVLEIEPRASHTPGKHSTTESQPQSLTAKFSRKAGEYNSQSIIKIMTQINSGG